MSNYRTEMEDLKDKLEGLEAQMEHVSDENDKLKTSLMTALDITETELRMLMEHGDTEAMIRRRLGAETAESQGVGTGA